MAELLPVATGVRLNVERGAGDGDPLLMIMGTSGSLGLWGEFRAALDGAHQTIAFDNRGLGGSERGEGEISMAGLAGDSLALLDALELERVHVLGWSLGSAVAQEMALEAPERIASLSLLGTWARADGFQRSMLATLSHPWLTGDLEAAIGAIGLAFSPQLLDSPEFEALVGEMLPLFPQTPEQVRTTVEQWQADLEHDTLERLGTITAPTLVMSGEQDLLTPPWQCQVVAERIPGARYEHLTGPGASHAFLLERTDETARTVLGFLAEHPLGVGAAAH